MNSEANPPAVLQRQVYKALVQNENDLVGLVAYALYKRDKIQFIRTIHGEVGRPPNQDQLDCFTIAALLDSQIAALRTQSEKLLETFTEAMLEEAAEGIVAEYQSELTAELRKSKSWTRAAAENLIGNLLAFAVMALVALIIYGSKVGVVRMLGDAFGYEVSEKAEAGPAAVATGTGKSASMAGKP